VLPAKADLDCSLSRKNNVRGYSVANREARGRRDQERVVAKLVQQGDLEEVQEGRDGGEVI
jgi:hypothetical protein